MGSRLRRAVLAALLTVPLAAVGVCGVLAPLATAPASCAADTEPSDCCSRSGAPASPRTPTPDRCAACGAAACALGETRETATVARATNSWSRAARPSVAHALARTAAARGLAFLAASPPKNILLATFRN